MRTNGCSLLLCALALSIAAAWASPVANVAEPDPCQIHCGLGRPCPRNKHCRITTCGGAVCEAPPDPSEVGICAFLCGPEKPCPEGKECLGTPCGGTACAAPPAKVKRDIGICANMCGPEKPCPPNERCVRTECNGTTCKKV